MRVIVAIVTGVAMGALVLGPISHIRAQQNRTRAVQTPAVPAIPETPLTQPDTLVAPPDAAIQVTDELVRPKVVRSPVVQKPSATPRPEIRRKPAEHRRSLLARLFLGAGDNRPKPFPRPRS